MAQYPCERHGARYTGPQRSAYFTLLGRDFERRERFRLCQPCFNESIEYLNDHFHPAELDVDFKRCETCGASDMSVAVFANTYDHKADGVAWYGRCCEDCAGGEVLVSLFSRQEALPLAQFGVQGGKTPVEISKATDALK